MFHSPAMMREKSEETEMADIRGTTAGNTLNAADGVTNGADEIYGRGGDDIVFGLGGDDLIADGAWSHGPARTPFGILNAFATYSSGGDDEFHGGDGDDRLFGDGGDDTLFGDGNSDQLFGGQGDDTLDGGAGSDIIQDDAGNEVIDGGTGSDTVRYNISGGGDAEPSDSEPLFPIGVKGVFADFEAGRSGFAFDDPSNNRIFNVSYANVETYETSSSRSDEDEMRGDNTADTFRTFGGDDIIEGRGGGDVIDGGAGNDTASYESSDEGVGVFLDEDGLTQLDDSEDAFGDRLFSIENLTGSRFGDFLTGDDGANTLKGLGGNDFLRGRDGGDRLEGGTGTDIAEYGGIFGSDAAVIVSTDGAAGTGGHAAGDRLIGVENISGSRFGDTLSGDDATGNKLFGNEGDDRLFGRGGNDTLDGGSGFNVLDGGAGIDTASYRNASSAVSLALFDFGSGGGASGTGFDDTLFSIEDADGSESGDSFIGSGADNTLRGFGGGDVLSGFGGRDTLSGGAGDDVLNGGLDADRLLGSAGADTATYRLAGAGVIVSLAARLGSGGEAAGDSYSSIENVIGSDHDDRLIGDAGVNQLSGAGGADVLIGGGAGDALSGAGGIDTASYETAAVRVIVDRADLALNEGDAAGDTYSSIEIVLGSAFDDNLRGSASGDEFQGGAGRDRLEGRGGNDTLRGGDGDVDNLIGGAGADALFGGGGVDANGAAIKDIASYADTQAQLAVALDGSVAATSDAIGDTFDGIEALIGASNFKNRLVGDGNDNTLTGGNRSDRLEGQDGVDVIRGGGDADLVIGGKGGDFLDGGAGADVFAFVNLDHGGDRIDDFVAGADILRFRAASLGEGFALGQDLDANQLVIGAAATEAFGQFVYNTAGNNGRLVFDANGTGAGGETLIANLVGKPAITIADFDIV
jgi:Ca2+-binding RTX toxin-like protein